MNRGRSIRLGAALLFAFSSAVPTASAQGPILIKEVVSREFSIHVGGVESDPPKQVVSREFSIHVENGPRPDDYREVVSREFGLVVSDAAAPPIVTEMTVDVSPTGDSATLNWSGYNQWAVGDIARFDIYTTDAGAFTDVTGMSPSISLPAESTTYTFEGLAEFTDHYFAVVAVDALGNSNTTVDYSAAYIISPQVISREVSLFVGGEPDPPYKQVVSREYGLTVADADPPPALTNIALTVSPSGDSVILDWSSYNQWAVRDIARFDIYLSDAGPFTDVTGMTPIDSLPSESTTLSLDGLTPNIDHFFAIVPVDALGNQETNVNYSAAYVLAPQVISRELSLYVGGEPDPPYKQVVSREYSLVVPDPAVPAPVTGVDSGFSVETSATDFGAVVLDYTSYNELAQTDVVAYRVYVGSAFFDDVTGLVPFATIQSGSQRPTLTGLTGGGIFHFAVVAEDALGNFDPTVRSFSAKASVSGVGEVVNLAAIASTADSLTFSWEAPPDTAAFLTGYHLFFAGAVDPILLPPGVTTYEFTGLDPATGYSLRVATLDIFMDESSGVSVTASTLLPNPANLALTLLNGNVVATWDAVTPSALVQDYKVYLEAAPISDTTGLTPAGTTVATQFDLGPLATVMDQHVAVAVVNVSGASDPNVVSVQASKTSQSIDFPEPTPSLTIPLIASASSGLPVRFEVTPSSLATISGDPGAEVLTALSGGNVTLTALQDGDATFWPAPPVAHVLRLPPVIASFTANGSEIGPGTILDRIDNLLRVDARDENGISQAEFSIRPLGGSFTSLGIDSIAVDGFTATLALDALPDGDYELQAVITAALTTETAATIRPVTIQLAPPVPPTITAPVNGATVNDPLVEVRGAATRGSEVFIDNNGTQVAGPLPLDGSGQFLANLTLAPGNNLLTARAENRAGSSAASAAVSVQLLSRLTLALDPPSFAEGASADLTITRNHDEGNTTVLLSQNVFGQLQLPGPVAIPDGSSEVTVSVTAINDAIAELDEGVTITATANGYASGSILATVIDDDRPTLVLTVNRSTVSEGAAPGELTATLTRAPVSATPFNVLIENDNPDGIVAPTSVTLPAFAGEVSFPLGVVDDMDIDGDETSTLVARLLDVTNSGILAESNPVVLTVTDDDGPTLSLSLPRAAVQEGESLTGTVTRNTGLGEALTVNLSVDLGTEAQVPATVTIPLDEFATTFLLEGLDDGTPDGNQSVLVEATAAGFAGAQAGITVTDLNLADLAVASLTSPGRVLTDEWVTYSYRIENQGPVDALGPVSVRVLLSDDPVLGDDVFLNEFTFPGGLPAGLFFDRTETFRTPLEAGDYWIIVEVDEADFIEEILESNNIRISATPMEVGAAYQATVSTETTVAPAGTPVVLTGSATNVSNGSPAAFKLVNIHLMVRGTTRIISALTDSSGEFSVTFHPLPGEGGSYTIGATHPGVTVPDVQDSFTLLGIRTDLEAIETTLVRGGAPQAGEVPITNLANLALAGIQVQAIGLPAGFDVVASLRGGASLPPLGSGIVDYSINATVAAPDTGEGVLRISSAEGAVLDVPLLLSSRNIESVLVVTPGRLERGMVPGRQTLVNFKVTNAGGAPSGPVRILLPPSAWLSTASASPLPSIPPGQSITVTLQLCPAADLPLTAYNGALQVAGNHNAVTVPFTFRALSDAMGDLVVNCEDEFTYFAASTPPLEGATVRVFDAVNGSEVANGTSGVDGAVTFADLREGYYRIEATAPDHVAYRETIFLESGRTNTVDAFLSRQLVRYIWRVVPTEIEDRYRIEIETVFETNVPAPVVTIEPSYIDLEALTEDVTQIDLKITNHGLIAANDVRVGFNSTPQWSINSLADRLGALPAKSSITVPVIIERLAGAPARAETCASPSGEVSWCFPCGDREICGTARIGMGARSENCGGPGALTGVTSAGGPGGIFSPSPVASGYAAPCDPCLFDKLLECIRDIISNFIPCANVNSVGDCIKGLLLGELGPLGDVVNCLEGLSNANTPAQAAGAGASCACSLLSVTGGAKVVCETVKCALKLLECYEDGDPPDPGPGARADDALANLLREINIYLELFSVDWQIYGSDEWKVFLGDDDYHSWGTLFSNSIGPDGDFGTTISAAEEAALLAHEFNRPETAAGITRAIARWNRSLTYYASGWNNPEDLPAGNDPDFIGFADLKAAGAIQKAAFESSLDAGFGNPLGSFLAAMEDTLEFLSTGEGVCARVKLQIEQEAVLTRDAFEASLEVINNDTNALENVEITLRVTDQNGVDATGLFGLQAPTVTGVSGGNIPGETTATWNWILIPSQDAAPLQETVYFVEGTWNYTYNGDPISIPLAPQSITVLPNPSLFLKYFHQRDVYADDPFTDPIEPSIPFTLGVMIENRGAGVAKNLTITSAQPEIIDNEKGLLVDFQIIATEVAGQNLSPSLTANFGDLQPGEIVVGCWLLTSTLQGLFIDYEASFEHIDGLGDPRLSLIDGVEIHETIRKVRALGAKEDGLPDFLTNDIVDLLDRPDTIHLSDGSTAPVAVIETGQIDPPAAGNLTVDLNAPAMGAGWSYLRIPNPGGSNFRVVRVTRSDGLTIPLDVNTWSTDRTFLGFGLQPLKEDIFHLLDCDSTGLYSVEYAPVAPPDSTPPTSMVTMLADQSSAFIDLQWSGMDNTGVSSFDIYVSTDAGPFIPWLEGTSATSALFEGTLGSTYSFYSIARDAAGNEEAPKAAGESGTTVSLENQPPELMPIANFTIPEGETLILFASGQDPDGPDELLRYSVSSSQPGLIINPITGRLRWQTGEENGGTEVEVTVTVTDGDPVPLDDSQTFTVTVTDTNALPVLEAPGQFTIDVGDPLQIQLAATDRDQPAQTLTYHLLGTPPAGMTLDPSSGLLEWTPGDEHEDQSFEILLEVRDDQDPTGVGQAVLYIDVLKKPGLPPTFDTFALLVWPTEGQFFHEVLATDPENEPVTITADLSALPGWAALRAAPGTGRAVLEWNTTGVAPGLYELPLTASTDRQQTIATLAIQVVPRAAFANYPEWARTYPLDPFDRFDYLDPNQDGLANLMAYALGVDPAGGYGSVQPDPRPAPFANATDYGLAFTMPTNGRFDLRYIVEGSLNLRDWNELARKEGTAPWTGTANVVMSPLRAPLERAIASLPLETGQSYAFLRLRVERLGSQLEGYWAWINPFALDPADADPLSDPNRDRIENLIAYSLDFGSPLLTTPDEHARRPMVEFEGGQLALLVTIVDGGQADLRYLVEESVNGEDWQIIALKEGTAPWDTATTARLVAIDGTTVQFAVESTRTLAEAPVLLLRQRVEAILVPPSP